MIKASFIESLNQARLDLLQAFAALDKSESFRSLCESSDKIRRRYDQMHSRTQARLREPFDGKFVVAVVGSSGHGKTTIIDEMFPGLAKRGWLETDVTDTTSQALRIEYMPELPVNPPVTVHSWSLDQIKAMFTDPEVDRQNRANGISVAYVEDKITVDARTAKFDPADFKKFKFPKVMDVYPFHQPCPIPADKLQDKQFISALTVKQSSKDIKTEPLLQVGSNSFNTLQLRAVVKDVTLKDDYQNIRKWLGPEVGDLGNLVFVDTPGIGTSGGMKDEVLTHTLEAKSRRILLELFANDELDIIVHLVLCSRQSDFTSLWKAMEDKVGRGEMDDLSERIVLAINGVNIFFTNADLKRHMKDPGDHLDTAIADNILEKMAPGRNFRPSMLCFLDSKRIIETSGFFKSSYEKVYAGYKDELESWLEPNTGAHKFLAKHGWVETFRENLPALLNPEDRGQGFLVRQIHRLILKKGERLLVKKCLCRTGLMAIASELRELTSDFYDQEGGLNSRATLEAVAQLFTFLDDGPLAIDEFCARSLDGEIDRISGEHNGAGWLLDVFENVCSVVFHKYVESSGASTEIAETFRRIFQARAQEWSESWGYADSKLPTPKESNGRTLELIRHSLKTHVREMTHQFKTGGYAPNAAGVIDQAEEDKRLMREALKLVESVIEQSKSICLSTGVAAS